MQPIMTHTSSKSLVELSTGEHETTFVNVTQMLSNLTRTPRLKWLDNLSPLHQEAVQLQQTPTVPAVQPPVAPTTLKQAAAQNPTAATRTQRKTPVTTDVHPPTGRADVAPRQSGHVSKAPQRLIEHM